MTRVEGPQRRETTRYPNRPAPVLALSRRCPRWIEGSDMRDEPVPATAERLPMAKEPAGRLSARSFNSIKFLVLSQGYSTPWVFAADTLWFDVL